MPMSTKASQSVSRRLRRGLLVLAGAVIAASASPMRARGTELGQPGQILTRGAAPFRTSLASMRTRGAATDPRGSAAAYASIPGSWGDIPESPWDSTIFPAPGAALTGGSLLRSSAALSASSAPASSASFAGMDLNDIFSNFGETPVPPDTSGAIGLNHFVELVNGGVAIYSRAGSRLSLVSAESFFATSGGHPIGYTFDPQILFDRRSGRWFASVLEINSGTDNDILLAVSETSDATGMWDTYDVPVGQSGEFTNFDVLGVDDNGVYFGMVMSDSTGNHPRIVATSKASLLAATPSLSTVYSWSNITDMRASPVPACNMDAAGPSAPAWFVSSSPTATQNVRYCTLTWSAGVPSLSAVGEVATPAYAAPLSAPALGSTYNLDVDSDRPFQAVIRGGELWTARNVGVNSTGGSSSADRTGCEWLELDVSAGTAATVVQSGRVYDPAASSPMFYFYPSITVTGQGSVALGFSGSSATVYAGAYTCGRLATDPLGTMGPVSMMKSGDASYTSTDSTSRNRWGNYSETSLDPSDDMTIWTVQEYATSSPSVWGTWIASIPAPAPTLAAPPTPPVAGLGRQGVTVTLDGTGLYDPGPGLASRFQAAISGDGVSNLTATVNGPTSVTLKFDVSDTATAGLRDVTITNPDGQTATAVGAISFAVKPAGVSFSLRAANGSRGDTVTLKSVVYSGGAPVSGLTVQFAVDGVPVGSAVSGSTDVELPYKIPTTAAYGLHDVTVSFAGTIGYNAATRTAAALTVRTNVAFSLSPAAGYPGDTVTLKTLMIAAGSPVIGRTVKFYVDSTYVGYGVSDSSGAALLYRIPASMSTGTHDVTVTFAGDSTYSATSRTAAALTVGAPKAGVSFSLRAASGSPGDSVTLKTLVYSGGAPVSGLTIQFAIDSTVVGTAVSDSSGASLVCTIPAGLSTGLHNVTVSFAGNSSYYASSRTALALTVN